MRTINNSQPDELPIEPDYCWQCVPVKYDSYPKEKTDHYQGDIFGDLFGFGSPHFLWRRFHKNICKALVIANLKNYQLKKGDDDQQLLSELQLHQSASFSIEIVARHQSLVLIISALEAYLKDSFCEILKYSSGKLENLSPERIIKKYNFQNIQSVNKAYRWLFDDESLTLVDNRIEPILKKRHEIVHKSYYDPEYSQDIFMKDYVSIFIQAEKFHTHFEVTGIYDGIKPD